MIQALLEGSGVRTERNIARALMSFDVSWAQVLRTAHAQHGRTRPAPRFVRSGIVTRDPAARLAARFRCELCGIPADEKALEVDHIVPRNKGGTDDRANLQALCYSCDATKRDRDDTDFRAVRESYAEYDAACPFCALGEREVVEENRLARLLWDRYPVTRHHALVIPRRQLARPFVRSASIL